MCSECFHLSGSPENEEGVDGAPRLSLQETDLFLDRLQKPVNTCRDKELLWQDFLVNLTVKHAL